jgi:hypothetical protein
MHAGASEGFYQLVCTAIPEILYDEASQPMQRKPESNNRFYEMEK